MSACCQHDREKDREGDANLRSNLLKRSDRHVRLRMIKKINSVGFILH